MTFSQSVQERVNTQSASQSVRLTLVGGAGTGRGGDKRGCFSPRSLQAVVLLG